MVIPESPSTNRNKEQTRRPCIAIISMKKLTLVWTLCCIQVTTVLKVRDCSRCDSSVEKYEWDEYQD